MSRAGPVSAAIRRMLQQIRRRLVCAPIEKGPEPRPTNLRLRFFIGTGLETV